MLGRFPADVQDTGPGGGPFATRSSTTSFSQRLMRRQRPPVRRALMVQWKLHAPV